MNLAEKYRPKYLKNIIGNAVIKKSLCATLAINRIPKSILISGKYGTGKTTYARSYARLINCLNVKKSEEDGLYEICGECDNCKNIERSTDYIEINAADQRGIDDMRDLISRCDMGLIDLKKRVVIIDECQQLRVDSQNILLKPLEDSSDSTVFIFCTTNPEKILSTVKSRCRKYHLKSISNNLILNQLKYICSQENLEYDDSALIMIADEANGSMRDAITILDQSCGQGKITDKIISSFTNLINLDIIYLLFENIVTYNMSQIYECIETVDNRNIPANKLFDIYIQYLNDLLIYIDTKNVSLLKYKSDDYVKNIRNHSEVLKKETVWALLRNLINTHKYLDSYPRHKHLLNLVFSESCGIVAQNK